MTGRPGHSTSGAGRARIAVIGCKGMLGRALGEELVRRETKPLLLDLPAFDMAEPSSVRWLFADIRPNVVVNAAAYTDVDGAESDPEAAERTNVTGPRLLAEAAAECEAMLVQVSTDYVFDGTKRGPYTEKDQPSPQGVYARTKFDGEKAVRRSGAKHLVVRTAWLYAPWGRNFVLTILAKAKEGASLRVVDDQRGSPTYAPDLARAILDLVAADAEGTVNAVNSGPATWFDLAAEAVKLAGLDVPITRVTTDEFPRPAPRPANSVLSTARFEKLVGRPLRAWREALAECVSRI
ncbi:MAG: dTDP-4-dehydrorhamnose reductase [Planctomycetota bacterium]